MLHNDYSVPIRLGLTSPSIALIQLAALRSQPLVFPFFDPEEGTDQLLKESE